MQKLRSIASPEERNARLAVKRERSAQARAAESPEETAARQAMEMCCMLRASTFGGVLHPFLGS